VTLTTDERAYLELYTPRTHGVELPRDLAKSMEVMLKELGLPAGLIEHMQHAEAAAKADTAK
jgi:hypothetical protein